ncbi:LytR/AlgR family response regulator transcription factor [Maledivibacter halophilus]|uniref:Response regulator of the LytR/AlgR family n=1 Tax=Maledivibacter halophilus TaxID=36842 RepID=A0A1T5IMP7_9FIRM|nr:LytTR family DNA-binding domain-containing protein [Maledivibacter halophilus]SKC40405.1 Response regulator of the LytR/AlgR family [Maledivibacter halophilus]
MKAIQNEILNENDNNLDKLAIKEEGHINFVMVKDILYFEKSHRKVLAHTAKNTYTLNSTLKELEENLDDKFTKTHRSFIVNKKKIKKIKEVGDRTYEIQFFDTDKKASLSRKKYEELMKGLSIF